jgi:F-type H+-transporting ATPase subunit epsilon
MLSTRTAVGSIGVLANHEPVLAMLEPTELRLYRSDTDIVRFAQAEGYLQFAENRALVLVEEAIAPDALDRETFQTRLREAQQAAEEADDGTERQARAQRDVRRYEAFLAVAQ